MMAGILAWIYEYGAFAIFFLLALGIIGLPIPDETLILFAGMLVAHQKLCLFSTLLAIYCGALTGITLSYILGLTCGNYVIVHFGSFLRIKPRQIKSLQLWFQQVGKWMLFFGYFIMGLRHLTGFVSGTLKLKYRQFALYAYSGMFVWATSIFYLGYSFHQFWQKKLHVLNYISLIIAVLLLITIYLFFYYQQHKFKSDRNV